jgi:hypothetical protein
MAYSAFVLWGVLGLAARQFFLEKKRVALSITAGHIWQHD